MDFEKMEYDEHVALTTTGLISNGCNINAGGYAKIGNLVIVNLRITKTVSGECKISGLPRYAPSGDNYVSFSCIDIATINAVGCFMRIFGEIALVTTSSSAVYIISGCYICE